MTTHSPHLLLVTHYYAPDGGAAATRLTPLAHYCMKQGWQVTVLTTMPHYPQGVIHESYRKRWSVVETIDGVRVIRVWLWTTSSARISRKLMSQLSFMVSAMGRGLGIVRPDVVLIEAQPIFTGVAGRILATVKRAPYVLNVSDLWPDHLLSVGAVQETSFIYRLARWVVDTGYRGSKALVAMSPEWARKLAVYSNQPDKITTILRGTDLKHFHPAQSVADFRAKHRLGNARIVSFIGTFATQYDFEQQLAVAERLKAREDVLFLYVGTGSQKEFVQERAKQLPNVRLIDWVAHDEIPIVWASSTVNYWSMRPEPLYEGTIPAKLYEAFACGVPVVAAQRGESARLITESGGGLVVEPNDSDSLVEALLSVLDSEAKRAEMSQKARTYAESHFDFEQSLGRYEQLLRQVVAQK